MTACKTCGLDAGGPIFWDGAQPEIEWPDECHECLIAHYKDWSERITRAFIASGLDAETASAVTGIDQRILSTFREEWEQDGVAYMSGDYEPYILEQACDRAVARLAAAGRKAGTAHYGDVIPFPDKAERTARRIKTENS